MKLPILAATLAMLVCSDGHAEPGMVPSSGVYRLPIGDGLDVQIFDDFASHRPVGRIDLFAINGVEPFPVVAAADGRVVAIQDGYAEQQSGRDAKDCHNNYVWIAHSNGEWTNYSHLARGSVTGKAGLHVGSVVKAGTYIGDEGAVGCAMLHHVHFEVVVPPSGRAIDDGAFLLDNADAKRERNPRFCGVPGEFAAKGKRYRAQPCGQGAEAQTRNPAA